MKNVSTFACCSAECSIAGSAFDICKSTQVLFVWLQDQLPMEGVQWGRLLQDLPTACPQRDPQALPQREISQFPIMRYGCMPHQSICPAIACRASFSTPANALCLQMVLHILHNPVSEDEEAERYAALAQIADQLISDGPTRHCSSLQAWGEKSRSQQPVGKGLQVLEMLERGETPPNVRSDINDKPPDPTIPPPAAQMQPRPKPWERSQSRSPKPNGESLSVFHRL